MALVMFAQPVTDSVEPVVKPDGEKLTSVKVTLEGSPLNADVGNVQTEAKPSEIYPEAAPVREIQISEDVPGLLEMVELPGGTFFMGSPDSDDMADDSEKPQHEVFIDDFAICRFPVTRKLYREVMEKTPEQWRKEQNDDQLPANYINWFEAVEFCNALSQRQGLPACYRIAGEQVEWDLEASGYRLPTEAEWEYAVRAGTTTRWFFGDDEKALGRYAWYAENAENRVHPVGEKEPNPWKLYDMLGNVWEWCWDWYSSYSSASANNPSGPDKGSLRVLRGGAFWDFPGVLRSAYRFSYVPENRNVRYGFRVVRGPRRQP